MESAVYDRNTENGIVPQTGTAGPAAGIWSPGKCIKAQS